MGKTIADKIDFLMKLTNTSNTALGRALNFDASYISRIRGGKRGLPSAHPFTKPAAAYFAARVTETYQRTAIAEELCRPWPDRETEAAQMLEEWLVKEPPELNSVERMIATMGAPADCSPLPDAQIPDNDGGTAADVTLYYGNSGKRNGVRAFLSTLCETGRAHTLLLLSDEGMEWLYEDDAFARTWGELLVRLIENGTKIKIIHTISRDANEMWEAVRKWLPLYMTGAIESYYCPRLRDGITSRTLFVAAGHSALIASSVQGQEGVPLNIRIWDKDAVSSLEEEFAAFLKLCRPLMESAFPSVRTELLPLLRAFLDAPGDALASFSDDVAICTKESTGALVVKLSPPYAAFKLSEPRMVAAVEDYLRNLSPDSEHTMLQLEQLANGMK